MDGIGRAEHADFLMSALTKLARGLIALAAVAGLGAFWFWHSVAGGGETPPIVVVPDGAGGAGGAVSPADEPRLELPGSFEGQLDGLRTLSAVRALAGDELEDARSRLLGLVDASGADEAGREQAGREQVGLAALFLAEISLRLADAEAALEYAERARELRPADGTAQHMVAKVLAVRMQEGGMLFAMKHVGTFKQALQRAIELDPSNIDARVEQAAFYMIVPRLAGGDISVGRTLAKTLEPLDPARAAWLRAMGWMAEDDPERASAVCSEALERFPGHQDLCAMLAGLVSDEHVEQAVALYETVLEGQRGESYYRSLYSLARLLIEEQRDHERALELLDEYLAGRPALGMLPSHAAATWRRGRAFEGLGRLDEARAAYERALVLDGDFEQALESLEQLGDEG